MDWFDDLLQTTAGDGTILSTELPTESIYWSAESFN